MVMRRSRCFRSLSFLSRASRASRARLKAPLLVAALLIAAGFLTVATGRAAPAPEGSYEAHRARGNAASDANRMAEASAEWRLAWALQPRFAIACAIGRAELRLGHAREAAEWLGRCVRLAPMPTSQGELETQEAELKLRDLARSRVAMLTIDTSDYGAEIFLNGELVGRSPLAEDLAVNPGLHRVTAKLGDRSETISVHVEMGQARTLILVLPPSTARAAPPAIARTTPSLPPPSDLQLSTALQQRLWILAIGSGLTVVSTVIATSLTISARSAEQVAANRLNELRSHEEGECRDTSKAPLCIQMKEADNERRALDAGASVMFTTAGVLAATTVALTLLPGEDGPVIRVGAQGVKVMWSW